MLLMLEKEYLSEPAQAKQCQKYTHSFGKHVFLKTFNTFYNSNA